MSASDDAAARDFFEAGSAAYESGRFDVALTAFEQGYALSPRAAFLFNMATSLDRLHRKEESLTMYQRYLPVAAERDRDYVERRIEFLTAELASDAAADAEAEPVAEPEPEPEPMVRPEPEDEGGSAFLSAPALIGFGVGVAGLATFAISGAISSSRFSEREETCAPGCSDDDLAPVRRTALIADIGLGVGIAGLAFGVIYGLVGPSGESDDDTGARLSVAPSREGAALQLLGEF